LIEAGTGKREGRYHRDARGSGNLKNSVFMLAGLREEVAELRANHDALRADVAGLKKQVQG
jgi:hypothetical protein